MKKSILFAFTLLAMSVSTTAHALSLEIENKSNWEIHELYFAPTSDKTWGPDQLGDEVIQHNETFKLSKITKGSYDVKFVDEDGDECIVGGVDFNASEHFVLTEEILLGCQANTGE